MGSEHDKNPFDQKPNRNLSDYILDDLETEEEVLEDLPFNTEDNEVISTEDIRICTDPAGAFFMKPEGKGTIPGSDNMSSGIYGGGGMPSGRSGMGNSNLSSKISGTGDFSSRVSDIEGVGALNTLPKENVEILTLTDEKVEGKNPDKPGPFTDNKRVKTSKTTTNKYVILLVTLGALLMMWYTTFAQPLAFNGTQMGQSGNGSWDIRFTDMYQQRKIGGAKELSTPSYSATKASFYISLTNPGDEITYNLTIKNAGTLNAKVSSINIMPENRDSDAILYYVTNISVGDWLDAGQSTTMTVTAKFNDNAVTVSRQVKNVSVIINYVQR